MNEHHFRLRELDNWNFPRAYFGDPQCRNNLRYLYTSLRSTKGNTPALSPQDARRAVYLGLVFLTGRIWNKGV